MLNYQRVSYHNPLEQGIPKRIRQYETTVHDRGETHEHCSHEHWLVFLKGYFRSVLVQQAGYLVR